MGRPREEVLIWSQVFPAPPIKREDEAIEERLVPPRVAERVPVHAGVKVWVSPEEVMKSWMLASEEVAKVCVDPVWVLEY